MFKKKINTSKSINVDEFEPINDKLNTVIDVMRKTHDIRFDTMTSNFVSNIYYNSKFEKTAPNEIGVILYRTYLSDNMYTIKDENKKSSCALCDMFDFRFKNNIMENMTLHEYNSSIANLNKQKVSNPKQVLNRLLNAQNNNLELKKIMFNNNHPEDDYYRLYWKNYLIVPNYEPYIENHFMIVSLNHNKNKMTGSQFMILDFTTLYELLQFYKLNNSDLSFMHNYSFAGSQSHLHLHLTNSKTNLIFDDITDIVGDAYYLIDKLLFTKIPNISNETLYEYNTLTTTTKFVYSSFVDKFNRKINLNTHFYTKMPDNNIFVCKLTENKLNLNSIMIMCQKSYCESDLTISFDDIINFNAKINTFTTDVSEQIKVSQKLSTLLGNNIQTVENKLKTDIMQFVSQNNDVSSDIILLEILKSMKNQKNQIADENFKKYVEVVHGILNSIESSVTHTFVQYWTKSLKYLCVYVVLQSKITIASGKANNNVKSANIFSGIYSNDPLPVPANYANATARFKSTNLTIDSSCFNIDMIVNCFEPLINQTKQLILYELKYDTRFDEYQNHSSYVTNYIYDAIKNKTANKKPKLLLMKGPFGVGKSTILKSKLLLDRFGINLSNTVVANVDEIRYLIPSYTFAINKIKSVLNNFLDKTIEELILLDLSKTSRSIAHLDIIKKLKIHDVIYDNSLKNFGLQLLDDEDYEKIYKYLFESRNVLIDGKTIVEYTDKAFNDVQFFCEKINKYLINFCIKNNYNLILETWKRDFDIMTTKYNFTQYDKFLIMFEVNNTKESRLFMTKNLLKRTFEEGRYIKFNISVSDLVNNDEYNKTFYDNIKIFNDYKIIYIDKKVDVSTINIKNIPKIISANFNKQNYIDFNIANNRNKCDSDDDIKKHTYEYVYKGNTHNIGCFNKSNIKTISEKDEINNIFTDIISKHILSDDTTRTILIYDFYKNYKQLIDDYILEYNLSNPLKLDNTDIIIVLKGTSGTRAEIIKSINKIDKIVKNIEGIDGVKQSIVQVKNTLLSLIDNGDGSLSMNTLKDSAKFRGSFKKSDIDFGIYINQNKVKNEIDFNKILSDIESIAIELMYKIREHYVNNNIYNNDNKDFINKFIEFFTKDVTYQNKKLSHILYKDKDIGIGIIDGNIDAIDATNFQLKDVLIIKRDEITNLPDDDKYVDIIDTFNILDKQLNNKENSYRISFNKSIGTNFGTQLVIVDVDKKFIDKDTDKDTEKEKYEIGDIVTISGDVSFKSSYYDEIINTTFYSNKGIIIKVDDSDPNRETYCVQVEYNEKLKFDLLRLKICCSLCFVNKKTGYIENMLCSGELFDVTFTKFNSIDSSFTVEQTKIYNLRNPFSTYNFSFRGYNIETHIKDVEKMMFRSVLNPWDNLKFDKRIIRINVLYLFYLLKQGTIKADDTKFVDSLLQFISDIKGDREFVSTHIFGSFILVKNYNKLVKVAKEFKLILQNRDTDGSIIIPVDNKIIIEHANRAGILLQPIILDERYINEWLDNYKKYILVLIEILDNFEQIYVNIKKIMIISPNITDADVNLQQWGGGLKYRNLTKKLVIMSGADGFLNVSNNEYKCIQTFFELLKHAKFNINGNQYKINDLNLREMQALGSGSFGYGIKIRGMNINPMKPTDYCRLIVKVVIGNPGTTKLQVLTESYYALKFAHIFKRSSFYTENYGFYSHFTLKDVTGNYQTIRLSDYYNKLSINNSINNVNFDVELQKLNLNLKPEFQNSDVSFILMEGGIDNIESIYNFAMSHYPSNDIALNFLSSAIYDIFDISCLSFKEYFTDIYFTHNDIKPANLIYKLNDNNGSLQIKLIDLGGIKLSNNFFENFLVATPYFKQLCLGVKSSVKTSPLYDLSTLAVSIIMSYLNLKYSSTVKEFKVFFSLDTSIELDIFNKRAILIKKIYENIIINTESVPVTVNSSLYKKKLCLSFQLFELLNVWFSIRCYYDYNAKFNSITELKDYIFTHEQFKIFDTYSGERVMLYGTNNELYQNLIAHVKSKMRLNSMIINGQSTDCDILGIKFTNLVNNYFSASDKIINDANKDKLLGYTADVNQFETI